MKTKILMSIMIIALATALVGGATVALFTDTATNPGNTFSAGTVIVDVGPTPVTPVIITNMAPGDTNSGSFTVVNNGTLALKYSVTAVASGPLFNVQAPPLGATPAVLTITGGTTGTLPPGGSTLVTYTVALPLTAGNQYQGDSGTVDFTINAVQDAFTTFGIDIPASTVTLAP
ncbi:MAG: Spore coat-associated protein N [Syntrophomonadaceae bacterium]|nr:Spore coat-associated protein N [Bacillota bacterium]